MKICICGKGGCGKSVLTVLLARCAQRAGKRALVVDSDESNSALYWMLGLDHPPLPLIDFAGGRKEVQKEMMSRFASGESEGEMSVLRRSEIRSTEIPSGYCVEKNGCALVAVGKIHQAMEGCACAMGVVSKEFLKKLRLEQDQVCLVDMEAGIEHFGRGIETGVDAVLAVVEPSLESVYMADKIAKLSASTGVRFAGAVLNKVSSPQMEEQLRRQLADRNVPVAGVLRQHQEILSACLAGNPLEPGDAMAEAQSVLDGALHAV